MSIRSLTFGESMGLIIGDEISSIEQLGSAKISTGGSEGNVAVGLSRLGVDSTWLSRVGNDGFGRRIVKDLHSQNVKVVAHVDHSASTGLMLKTTPRAGETVVDYHRRGSAASKISVDDFKGIDFDSFDHIHLSGITPALSESCRETWFAVAQKARDSGCIVSLDVNYRSKLWSKEEAAGVLKRILRNVNILIAGLEEAQLLVNASPEPLSLARSIQEQGPQIVAIKLGELGALVVDQETSFEVKPIKVQVIDTVGAGDAFSAAFIATYLKERSVKLALDHANVAGGLACAHPGDWQGFPTLEEIFSLINKDPVQR